MDYPIIPHGIPHGMNLVDLINRKNQLTAELNAIENRIQELNFIEWNKCRDKAERTYKRWNKIRIELLGELNRYLIEGYIPGRDDYLIVKREIEDKIRMFRDMIDVYGNDWLIYGVKAGSYYTDRNTVNAGLGNLENRLSDIGFKVYPDLMF
jgi:hypothetical protein